MFTGRKNQDLCERHNANQAHADHEIELLENACRSQVQITVRANQTNSNLENQLTEKIWEIEDLQGQDSRTR